MLGGGVGARGRGIDNKEEPQGQGPIPRRVTWNHREPGRAENQRNAQDTHVYRGPAGGQKPRAGETRKTPPS